MGLQCFCDSNFWFQGSGWKIVASFEGTFPNKIKQLPLDRHFDINNVKRVCCYFFYNSLLYCVRSRSLLTF
ncbi:hypothetical protein Patl1_07143 [Pistacia atlantica]|uniref:Uncharacterized protein n=1 Tax=Pistacia atlantica TaxID=434234 RepID=A0ACC1AI56_9ROSI|nr:hypothetical protein Patl1_07143 [Pistacia atlantica]